MPGQPDPHPFSRQGHVASEMFKPGIGLSIPLYTTQNLDIVGRIRTGLLMELRLIVQLDVVVN